MTDAEKAWKQHKRDNPLTYSGTREGYLNFKLGFNAAAKENEQLKAAKAELIKERDQIFKSFTSLAENLSDYEKLKEINSDIEEKLEFIKKEWGECREARRQQKAQIKELEERINTNPFKEEWEELTEKATMLDWMIERRGQIQRSNHGHYSVYIPARDRTIWTPLRDTPIEAIRAAREEGSENE